MDVVRKDEFIVLFGVVDKDGKHMGEILMKDGAELSGVVYMLKNVLLSIERPVDGVC